MTIIVTVKRHNSRSGKVDSIGEYKFVTLPREGETVVIDAVGEGEVQRIEHLIAPGRPPEVRIFIDDEAP